MTFIKSKIQIWVLITEKRYSCQSFNGHQKSICSINFRTIDNKSGYFYYNIEKEESIKIGDVCKIEGTIEQLDLFVQMNIPIENYNKIQRVKVLEQISQEEYRIKHLEVPFFCENIQL
jgi:hypothetical protein